MCPFKMVVLLQSKAPNKEMCPFKMAVLLVSTVRFKNTNFDFKKNRVVLVSVLSQPEHEKRITLYK